MKEIQTITLILIAGLMASGLFLYHEKDTSITVEGTTVTVEAPLGAPQQFIMRVSTSTPSDQSGFAVATSSNLTVFGTTTHMIYGSSTIQQYDAGIAFRILSPATTTVFSVDTSGNLIISGTCTGCGGGGALDPDLIQLTLGDTIYFSASTTDALAWVFLDGFVSQASSTIDANLTITGNVGIGTDSPVVTFTPTLQIEGSNPAFIIDDSDSGVDYLTTNVASGVVNIFFDVNAKYNIGTAGDNVGVGFSEKFTINSSGNVGIGDTTPTYKLTVNGNAQFDSFVDASYFVATSSNATSTFAGGLTVDSLSVGSTATSTFGNGMRIESGTLRIDNVQPNKALYADSNGSLKVWDSGFSFSVSSSSMSTTTAVFSFQFPNAITLTEVSCNTTLQGTSTFQLGEATRVAPSTVTDVMGASAVVAQECGSEFVSATTSFQNASIAADVPFVFEIVDAAPTGDKPTTINVSGKFTIDD